MRRSFVLAFTTSLLLFAGAQARALPPGNFCQLNPTSPLCIGEEPPVDPTDPCIENPQLCEPPPVDPCEVDPASCEAEPEPEDGSSASLEGTSVLRGNGFKNPTEASAGLSFDEATFSIVLLPACQFLTGNLVAKGKHGNKFQLFLDDDSANQLAAVFALQGAIASGGTSGNALGKTSKLILKRDANGSARLKIKFQVHVDGGVGEVVFKANLTGAVQSGHPKVSQLCAA